MGWSPFPSLILDSDGLLRYLDPARYLLRTRYFHWYLRQSRSGHDTQSLTRCQLVVEAVVGGGCSPLALEGNIPVRVLVDWSTEDEDLKDRGQGLKLLASTWLLLPGSWA